MELLLVDQVGGYIGTVPEPCLGLPTITIPLYLLPYLTLPYPTLPTLSCQPCHVNTRARESKRSSLLMDMGQIGVGGLFWKVKRQSRLVFGYSLARVVVGCRVSREKRID